MGVAFAIASIVPPFLIGMYWQPSPSMKGEPQAIENRLKSIEDSNSGMAANERSERDYYRRRQMAELQYLHGIERTQAEKVSRYLNKSEQDELMTLLAIRSASNTVPSNSNGQDVVARLNELERKMEVAASEARRQDSSRDQRIEQATLDFKEIKFSYSKPKGLAYNKSNRIVLSIGSSDPVLAQTRAGEGAGPVKSDKARLAYNVKASLEGPQQLVDIQLANSVDPNSSIKALSTQSNANWTWYVTPKTLEPITLTLTIFNEVKIDSEIVELEGPAYSDTFTVNASTWDRWSATISGFWAFVIGLAGLASLVTATIEVLKWRKERRATQLISGDAAPNPTPHAAKPARRPKAKLGQKG